LLVVPDKMAREKIQHLRAMGVDVRITRSDVGKGHPEYYQDMAQAIAAKLNNAVYINQFSNPANPRRTRPPPARRSSSRWRATSTRWSWAWARAAR
jgi:cysteine synthase